MNQQQHDWRTDRVMQSFILLLALSSLTGCGLTRETHRIVDLAKRTTFIEPRFYDYVHSDKLAQREARLLAEQAWSEVAPTLASVSRDYENGFTEGFADYLYRGGEGEPPLIPPRGYWNLRFLNQFGKASTNDWYAGFRHGAQTCKSTGLRDMWIVPTSLLVGKEEKSLPEAQQELWSAGPSVLMAPAEAVPNDVDRQKLDDEPGPPIPDSRPVTVDEQKTLEETSTPSDANDDDSGPVSTGRPAPDSSDDMDDPFGNDPLTPGSLAPEAPATNGAEDNIFQLPDDAFESSDSFEADVDDALNFQSSQRTTREGLAIRSVRPASEIPSPVVLTSGEYPEDLPPPPDDTPLILSTDLVPLPSSSAPQPKDIDLPRGRPRMVPIRARNEPTLAPRASVLHVPSKSTPQKIAARTEQILQADDAIPMRVGEVEKIAQRPSAPRHTSPMRLELSPKSTGATPSEPTKPTFDDSLLLDLPPLGLSAPSQQEESPVTPVQRTATKATSKESAPVVVWLDDDVPARPEPIPNQHQEAIVIDRDDWQPFANAQEAATDFAAPNYQGVMDENTMQRSTQWNPQRASELPLRAGKGTKSRLITTPARGKAMVIQPAPKPADSSAQLKVRATSPSKSMPRIYVEQPGSTQSIRPATDAANLNNASSTDWRFSN